MTIWKLEINRLLKAELIYEVISRGHDASVTVDSLRRLVRSVIQLDANKSISVARHSIPHDDDKTAIESAIVELRTELPNFDGDTSSSLFLRVSSLWVHIHRRCELMHASTEEEQQTKRSLLLTITLLQSEFETKIKKMRKTTFGEFSRLSASSPVTRIVPPQGDEEPELLSSSEVDSDTEKPVSSQIATIVKHVDLSYLNASTILITLQNHTIATFIRKALTSTTLHFNIL
ncbi:hypothetical protein FQR65_LT15726 [Abscondita terminalis]|nr:hypothetical protein FQR65_LT15726 [Abscondita terminalis]